MDQINKLDAALYIDVNCYTCKKLMALSNSIEFEGRKYCLNCIPKEMFPDCSVCGFPNDPTTCWCGDPMDKHSRLDSHMAIPLGCQCYRDKKDLDNLDCLV